MRASWWFILFITLPLIPIATSSQSNSPQTPVEISGEPRHHPKFENEYVRVWDVTVPAGDATLWHAHRNDNVVVTLGDASLRIETLGGTPAESQWKFGEVKFGKATYVHRAMNIGTTPFHNMTIEILKLPVGSEALSTVKDNSDRKPVLENERVRVYRLSLAPGESTGTHTHHLPSLAIAITNGDIEVATSTKDKDKLDRLTLVVGDARWRAGGVTHSIKNTGKTRFEAADIEVK